MDSPFNQGFGRGHNPSSLLQTSANSSAYQVNVNRTKTRKWVEAKAQNYDGDDWGASEYDDDDEPPLPPLPSAPSSAAATAAPASQPAPHRLASPPNVQSSVDNQAVISGSATLSPTVQRADKALPSVVASPPPLPRPSDVYRRMEEDKERQHHTGC
ncbi:hypothetical protein CDD83_8081 [Cordyceps sp. RAO-2017]|nr:hypothetical protein CDD83_8081 [Cordyceps sp. RAO-2017]